MEIALPLPDVLAKIEKHLLAEFALAIEEWSNCVATLTKWEDDYLLDQPTAETLAAHKRMLERLLGFGRFISLATDNPEFPDRKTADIVAATQAALKDKLLMWHQPKMSREEADRILSVCFPK